MDLSSNCTLVAKHACAARPSGREGNSSQTWSSVKLYFCTLGRYCFCFWISCAHLLWEVEDPCPAAETTWVAPSNHCQLRGSNLVMQRYKNTKRQREREIYILWQKEKQTNSPDKQLVCGDFLGTEVSSIANTKMAEAILTKTTILIHIFEAPHKERATRTWIYIEVLIFTQEVQKSSSCPKSAPRLEWSSSQVLPSPTSTCVKVFL